MYYIGTKKQCAASNSVVKTALKYEGATEGWGTVTKHPENYLYAVEKHPRFSNTSLHKVESLGHDWTTPEE